MGRGFGNRSKGVKGIIPALSPRQEQVLRLLAEGYMAKEIGARLSLSVKTVETYKAQGFARLRLTGRVDLIRYALKEGWLVADDDASEGRS